MKRALVYVLRWSDRKFVYQLTIHLFWAYDTFRNPLINPQFLEKKKIKAQWFLLFGWKATFLYISRIDSDYVLTPHITLLF